MSSTEQDDVDSLPRETLVENLKIVQNHIPKIIERLEKETEVLKQQLLSKDAEIAALKEQLAASNKKD